MCKYIVNGRACKIPSKSNEYCHIHDSDSKLQKKIQMQSNELTIINKRLSEAMRKLQIVEMIDYVKYQLTPVSIGCSFRDTISNPIHQELIESIFKAPQSQCLNIYSDLLNKRNLIAHKYTNREWCGGIKKTHGKSIQQLIGSIRAKTLEVKLPERLIDSPVMQIPKDPWSDISGIKRLSD